MTEPTARLWDLAGNYALAQVEGRRFPGLLIQGDSLFVLREMVREALVLRHGDDVELFDATLHEVAETLDGMVAAYERMMGEQGMKLPYFPKS